MNIISGFTIIDYINIMLVHLLHNDEDNFFVNGFFFYFPRALHKLLGLFNLK